MFLSIEKDLVTSCCNTFYIVRQSGDGQVQDECFLWGQAISILKELFNYKILMAFRYQKMLGFLCGQAQSIKTIIHL